MRSHSHSQLKFLKPRRGKRAAINSVLYTLLLGVFLLSSLAGFAEASGGLVITGISGRAYAMVIDSLGRIVTAGAPPAFGGYWGFGLTRYNSDGSLDTTFGNGGLVTTDISAVGLAVGARAVAIDNLGRIIVAGNSYPLPKSPSGFFIRDSKFLVARYNSDGSLDGTFGNGGLVTTDIGGEGKFNHANAVTIDSLGRIVVAGYTTTFVPPATWGPSYVGLARYNSDGSLDSTFGDG